MSYNILADLYLNLLGAQEDLWFPYCPKHFLKATYRYSLILRELPGYNADVMCLQEVDQSFWLRYLEPYMSHLGYTGAFALKGGKVSEGEVILLKNNRFRLVSHETVVLSKLMDEEAYPENKDIVEHINQTEWYAASFTSRPTALQSPSWKPERRTEMPMMWMEDSGRLVLGALRRLNQDLLRMLRPEMDKDIGALAGRGLKRKRRLSEGEEPPPKRTSPLGLWHDREDAAAAQRMADSQRMRQLDQYLELACGAGDEAAVRALLHSGLVDVNRVRQSPTAWERVSNLVFAIYLDHLSIFRILLHAGADPNRRDLRGNTALYYAVKFSNNPEYLKALLTCGKSEIHCPELPSSTKDILDFIIKVKKDKCFEFVRVLLQAGIDPNSFGRKEEQISAFWHVLTTKNLSCELTRLRVLELLFAAGLVVDVVERCLLCKVLNSPDALIPGLTFSSAVEDWYDAHHRRLHTLPPLATLAARVVRTHKTARTQVGTNFDRQLLPREIVQTLQLTHPDLL